MAQEVEIIAGSTISNKFAGELESVLDGLEAPDEYTAADPNPIGYMQGLLELHLKEKAVRARRREQANKHSERRGLNWADAFEQRKTRMYRYQRNAHAGNPYAFNGNEASNYGSMNEIIQNSFPLPRIDIKSPASTISLDQRVVDGLPLGELQLSLRKSHTTYQT